MGPYLSEEFDTLLSSISSSYAKIKLHTETQLPRLSGSALKVPVGVSPAYMGSFNCLFSSFPLSSHSQLMLRLSSGCDHYYNEKHLQAKT